MNEVLLKYGLHLEDCPCYIPVGNWKDNYHHTKTVTDFYVIRKSGIFVWTVRCTCGYYEALDEV